MRYLWPLLFLLPIPAFAQSSPPPSATFCASSAAGPWAPCPPATGGAGSANVNISQYNGTAVGASNPIQVVQTPSVAATAGFTPVTSAVANETCHTFKAAPGNLFLVDVYNSSASTTYLEIFNSTTAPSNGTVTQGQASGDMIETPIPVNATTFVSKGVIGSFPITFSAGITACLSTTNGLTYTGSATGNFTGFVQ